MDDVKKSKVLMFFSSGEILDERWLLRQGGCSVSELEQMVDEDLLTLFPKDKDNFMSDNRYMMTDTGKKFRNA